MEEAILYPLPPPADVVPRRLTEVETQRVELLCRLLFVSTSRLAPADIIVPGHSPHKMVYASSERMFGSRFATLTLSSISLISPSSDSPMVKMLPVCSGTVSITSRALTSVSLNRFPEECVCSPNLVRALLFRFEAFGRPVKHTKKWEEGVFSDLRNLKPGVDACLEEPK